MLQHPEVLGGTRLPVSQLQPSYEIFNYRFVNLSINWRASQISSDQIGAGRLRVRNYPDRMTSPSIGLKLPLGPPFARYASGPGC